jgi:hypothetical protein
MSPMPTSTLGKYELLGLLATGGMGEIFLARQRGPAGFSKLLVVKRILRHLASDPAFVGMFLNEAKLAGLLMHPNIVQIYELGSEAGDYFIAMEYVRGHNLRSVLRELRGRGESVDPALSAQLAIQALEGLHYAHTLADASGSPLEIVHRDVSPDNILVSEQGGIKLVDFGIAKALNATTSERSEVKGKFAYMAPEQLNGERVDRRADVYSVGCILYELLGGAPRFGATSAGALVGAVLKGEAPVLSSLRPDLSPKLVQIVDRAVCPDREERFGTAREMAQALEETLAEAGRVVGNAAIGGWLTRSMGNPVPSALLNAEASVVVGAEPAEVAPKLGTRVMAGTRASTGSGVLPGTRVLPETSALPGASALPETRIFESPHAAEDGKAAVHVLEAPRIEAPRRRRWIGWGAVAAAAALAVAWIAANRSSRVPVAREAESEARPAAPSPVASDASGQSPAVQAPLAPSDAASPSPALAAAGEPKTASLDAGVLPPPASREPHPEPGPAAMRAAPPTRHRKPGRITVLSHPWSTVYWNGRELGDTPLTKPIELPAGRQVLILRNAELKLEKRVSVEVPSGGTAEVKVTLNAP